MSKNDSKINIAGCTLDDYFNLKSEYSKTKMLEKSIELENQGGAKILNGITACEDEQYEEDYESETDDASSKVAGMSLGEYFETTSTYSKKSMKEKSALLKAEIKEKEKRVEKVHPIPKPEVKNIVGMSLQDYLGGTGPNLKEPEDLTNALPLKAKRKEKKKKKSNAKSSDLPTKESILASRNRAEEILARSKFYTSGHHLSVKGSEKNRSTDIFSDRKPRRTKKTQSEAQPDFMVVDLSKLPPL